MFVGGTNFGFWNGANNQSRYAPTITSYDYHAPISECGDFTQKAHALRTVLEQFKLSPVDWPPIPQDPPKAAYGKVTMSHYIGYEDLLDLIKEVKPKLKDVVPMEFLDINNQGGQGYGYIIYRKTLNNGGPMEIKGNVTDRAQIFVNGQEIWMIDYEHHTGLNFNIPDMKGPFTLDIMVENMGRVNYDRGKHRLNDQRKGIMGSVYFNKQKLENWIHIPLEFCDGFYKNMKNAASWKPYAAQTQPAAYRGHFEISQVPKDTFLLLEGWIKGIVFINGHHLGRYWNIGPQKTLYVPAPILLQGKNEIIVFDQYNPKKDYVSLIEHPDLGQLHFQKD